MVYMGSKARIAKYILPYILKDRKDKVYIEPFCGGCNCIDIVPQGHGRIANDVNMYLIALLKKITEDNWIPPMYISEEEYHKVRENKDSYDPAYVGLVGFLSSFGTKFFGGYARFDGKDRYKGYVVNIISQKHLLKGIEFKSGSYIDMQIPKNSVVYCDPPYIDTTGYKKDTISHDDFYTWVRDLQNFGVDVFISELTAPDDFCKVWEKKIRYTVDTNGGEIKLEGLYVHKAMLGL